MTTPFTRCIVVSLPHHLDHLAPLSFYEKIALVVRSQDTADALHEFYPQIPFYEIEKAHFLPKVKEILCTTNSEVAMRAYHQALYNTTPTIVRLHHGYSDKIQDFSIYDTVVGYKDFPNHRLRFYKQFKDKMLQVASKYLPIPIHARPLLIALSWDRNNVNQQLEMLSQHPAKDRFVFRVHPLLGRSELIHFKIQAQYGVHLLDHTCPYIYPFLELFSGVLTDCSSIGYDALYFKKPLMVLDDIPLKQFSSKDIDTWIAECDQAVVKPHFQEKYFSIFGH